MDSTYIIGGEIIVGNANHLLEIAEEELNADEYLANKQFPQATDTKQIRLTIKENPLIDMYKPNGKKVVLSIDKQAEIKLSNGGLKSKTVAVD